jgi:hypothetical protein
MLTLNISSIFPLDKSIRVMNQGGTKVFHWSVGFKGGFPMTISEGLLNLEVLNVQGIVFLDQYYGT